MRGMRLFARRTWGRRRWPIVEGVVIDKRHLTTLEFRGEQTSATTSVDEYLVEVQSPVGARERLRITELDWHIPTAIRYGAEVRGERVRVHLNAKGTSAVFAADPRESKAERKRREQERISRDEERFRRHENL